jgi:hypothetical protein
VILDDDGLLVKLPLSRQSYPRAALAASRTMTTAATRA